MCPGTQVYPLQPTESRHDAAISGTLPPAAPWSGSVTLVRVPAGVYTLSLCSLVIDPMLSHDARWRAVPESLLPLFERLAVMHGEETAGGILSSMAGPRRTGYIRNPLLDAAFSFPSFPVEPVEDLPGCFSVAPRDRDRLLAHPAVAAGAVYPMNPSSVLAVRLLDVNETHEVLDLAAGPGGKTLLLAIAMANGGRIAAVEPVKGRFHRMRANLDRCGVRNVQFYQADGRSIGRKVPGRFDRVLLDAPCSSEARIRLDDPASWSHWKLRKVKEAAKKQRGLIRSGFTALRPGGEMVYCTCSFAPEENELIVQSLLRAEPDAALLPLEGRGIPGLISWQNRDLDVRLALTRRILPDHLFHGFFLARIRRLS